MVITVKINVMVELVMKYNGKPLLHAERNAANLATSSYN